MANILRWIHLSDLHMQSPMPDGMHPVFDALWKDIPQQIELLKGPLDFIAFTGDVAYSGKAGEYALAEKEFFRPLKSLVNVPWSKFFIVPGNHDVDWSLTEAVDGDPSLRRQVLDVDRVDEVLADEQKRKLLLSRMSAYADFVRSLAGIEGGSLIEGDPVFGYVARRETPDRFVAVLGLNTAWTSGFRKDTDGNVLDERNLVLGQKQVNEVKIRSPQADLRIALMHHPHDCLSEKDRMESGKQLRKDCGVILHGHYHVPDVERFQSLVSQSVVIPAGATYQPTKYTISYNLARLDLDTGDGLALLRRYSPERFEYIADNVATGDELRGQVPFVVPLPRAGPSTPVEQERSSLKPVWLRLGRERQIDSLKSFLRHPTDGTLWIWGEEGCGIHQFLQITRWALDIEGIYHIELDAEDVHRGQIVGKSYFVGGLRRAAGLPTAEVTRDKLRDDEGVRLLVVEALKKLRGLHSHLAVVLTNLQVLNSAMAAWVVDSFSPTAVNVDEPDRIYRILTWEGSNPPIVHGKSSEIIYLPRFAAQEVTDFFRRVRRMPDYKVREFVDAVYPGSANEAEVTASEVYWRLASLAVKERWV
jgi:hypothetical protein